MSNDVWVGPMLGPAGIGDMQGLHGKFFGEEWDSLRFRAPVKGEEFVRPLLCWSMKCSVKFSGSGDVG